MVTPVSSFTQVSRPRRWPRQLLIAVGSLASFVLSFAVFWRWVRNPDLAGDMSLLVLFGMLLWSPVSWLLIAVLDRWADRRDLPKRHPVAYPIGAILLGAFCYYPGGLLLLRVL